MYYHLCSVVIIFNIFYQLVQGGVFFKDHSLNSKFSRSSNILVLSRDVEGGHSGVVKPDVCLASCTNDKDCISSKNCNICHHQDKICTTGCGIRCRKDSDCSGTKWCKACKGISGCPEKFCPKTCKRSQPANCGAKCYRNEDCHGGMCYLCQPGGTCAID